MLRDAGGDSRSGVRRQGIVLVHRPRAGTTARRGGGVITYDRDGVANRPRELGWVSTSLARGNEINQVRWTWEGGGCLINQSN